MANEEDGGGGVPSGSGTKAGGRKRPLLNKEEARAFLRRAGLGLYRRLVSKKDCDGYCCVVC